MLTLENITKSYFIGEESMRVLDSISITFPSTGFIGIKGESGCGKSTLLNIIASLEKADQGDVLFYNQVVDSQYLKKEITFISQNHDLVSSLTVKDNITIACKIAGINYSNSKLNNIAKTLDIETLLSYYPHQLSGGQKRRVSIARGILKDASILLADEPTGALHLSQAHEVMKLLQQQSHHRLVLIVSHDDDLLKEYCDDILVLEKGKLHGKIKEKKKIDKKESEDRKYSLLFYVFSQIKAQKYMLFFLVIFQIIIITSLTLMITGIHGVEYALETYYFNNVSRNIMTIENFDSHIFQDVPLIEEAITSYDYILSYGLLSEDLPMSFLPHNTSHIKLKRGRMLANSYEIIVNETLHKDIGDKLNYTYQQQVFELTIVGIVEENFIKEKMVYFSLEFQNLIPDYINQQMIVVESQNCEKLYEQLSKEYIVYCDAIESKESYTMLLNLAIIICFIFFVISFICSFFLFYIVYSTIGIKRKMDSAILMMMGLSHHSLFLLFILEALWIGLLMSIAGIISSYIAYYYMNNVIMISQYFVFSLKLKTYLFSIFDLYALVIIAYVLLSVISAYVPARKIVHSHLVLMLREE